MQQIIFVILFAITFFFAFRQFRSVWLNIQLGKPQTQHGDVSARLKNLLLVALGQKKMFKNWIPAIFHLFIYVAFLFTQIELIEIIIDGVFGEHRFFAPMLGVFYTVIINTIEILTVLALAATFVFLYRRNLLKIPRLVKSDLDGWPRLDGNVILIGELLLVTGILMMNSSDVMLQSMMPDKYPSTGYLAISGMLGPMFWSGWEADSLVVVERFGWWLHFIVVLGFVLYLPYSKHLHIFLAFPNTYFAPLTSRGQMENMPEIMNEVKNMLGMEAESQGETMTDLPEFGARDIFDLNRINLLNAYTCTECGRCSDVCPANLTGKKLSPRKIMMDIRDRVTEVGTNIKSGNQQFAKDKEKPVSSSNYDDGKSLFDYISREELHACTTCHACVEACPVLINPLDPILKMRRYEILTESSGPADWLPMFTAMENGGSVWQIADERDAWRTEM